MRWSWLRAIVLGTIIGPAPILAEPIDAAETSARRAIGLAVQGVNFHVWDEESREAMDWAGELIRAGGKTHEAGRRRNAAARSAALAPLEAGGKARLARGGGGTHDRAVARPRARAAASKPSHSGSGPRTSAR